MPHRFFLEENLKKGQQLLDEGCAGEIVFSGGTYQVEVKVGKDTFWPFLQVSDSCELKDHFCTCDHTEDQTGCIHEAAAWIRIFNHQTEPLHIRFQHSLWSALCRLAMRRHGEDPEGLQRVSDHTFYANSPIGKKLFSVEAKTPTGKKQLKTLIAERKKETEETSLKFSNLDPEELSLWKAGMPTPELSFELSFWSDIAKGCFQEQEENQPYQIRFGGDLTTLPKEMVIEFTHLKFFFYIAEANWPGLIPALLTVNSPLEVQKTSDQQIKKINYDEKEQAFHLDLCLDSARRDQKSCQLIGEWIYIPGQGFIPSYVDPLLKEKVISSNHIGEFLHKHHFLLKNHLEGALIHEEMIPVKYHLAFNEENALVITGYLFEKGDLEEERAGQFGSWAYLPEKGFFQLDQVLFPKAQTVISAEEVSSFVSRHRHWLHGYEGFETHITCIDSALGYELTQEGLKFQSKLDFIDQGEAVIDFPEWIYIKGRGFYAKDQMRVSPFLKPNLMIKKECINQFIKDHKEELESVNGFFTEHSPVHSSGLKIALNQNNKIEVSPFYHFYPGVKSEEVSLFADYSFVKGQGFAPIPPQMKLPSPYFQPLEIDDQTEPYFVAYEIDALRPYIMDFDVRLQKPDTLELKLELLSQEKEGYWSVKLLYQTAIGELLPYDIWKALGEGKRYLFSSAGLIILKSSRFNWLKNLPKKRWLKKGELISLTTLELLHLLALDPTLPPEDEASLILWKRLQLMEPSTPPCINGLKSTLRPYQLAGLKWLWFLHSYGLSGLLCDEMGLGKTHQAMALLVAALHEDKEGKFLVVCPTSVIFHWQDLLERFLPHLRICIYYGAQRTLEDFQEKFDLLLTSYGTLRSQKEGLGDLPFSIAIFDEIQTAKNHHSQTHKALKNIQVKTRIGLTGTPIENHLLELKALFDVVLPGYMPTETVYKELFVHPIEKQQDPEKKQMLARLIQPFVLRRKKTEVLLELPEKVESIAYAPLSEEQKKLYQEVYLASKDQLLPMLHDVSKPAPYLHVFALLTKLKQICNHPALYLNQESSYQKHASGKWDLFVDLLQQTRMSGQKLVVFSQYLGMIDIIEHYLKQENIQYASIRGSTRDRKEQVERFKNDPQCEIFVGSLQAAGVGIDLISASVLIHYDRWWNPAKENQATDRIHRMGQCRGVQVFKMITRSTLEEKIHHLIERKLTLVEDILGYDDQAVIKTLSRDELIRLLQLIETHHEE
ncbi:DEAD/DEAH box helicase [Rhabdochlamydiaceae symbiont of Dictyostelium giganteum]|uniref:DEAD/DEAH box helicase n=1 Tax=Rhabdochlamydiaceae symbiont of Dictyostelium giganteum TaxID=3342349 RepID=UPI003851776A